ncbi:MAG TPA: DUF4838 domain-containing protein [Verrucomicrobiae bacterium]|nr:DUF4838 domain-containing protein [Verrucomicrobiae bacterium]
MRHWHWKRWGLATALACVVSAPASGATTIAEKAGSRYRIIVAADAIPSERYAAEELQRYLERMSSARLPIVTDTEAMESREVLLGDNAHLRKLKLNIDFRRLGTDGFALRTDGKRLIIAGGRPRGTLYGVYTLLEEKLGVRWFTPEFEVVPKRSRVRLPKLDETQIPALEYREVYWTEMMRDADFAARHRLNGNHYRLAEKHGGRAAVYYPFVHSFDMLVPRELYQEHPEYFPLIDGQRKDGYVQRCLSNPDVLKIAIDRVRQWLKEHPEATIISVSQNDTFNYCQCEKCQALDDAEGSPAASLIRFVNAIAEDVERDHPNVRIDTLAYQYSRKPPRTLRPRHNVIVRLCSIECCFAHPLETCSAPENQRFRDDIIAWQPVAPLLYVWDYTPNFSHYQQPFPNFDALQPNVQFFVKHGVKGLFEEGNYSGGGNGEMGPLRAYVLAKLLWNPYTDVQRHIIEFLNAYYGKAANNIRAYLELLHRQVREKGYHAHIYDPPAAPYLNNEAINAAEKLFDEAERLADDDTIRFRVQVARLPIWYVELATNRVTGDAKAELLRHFLAVARQAGISNISEGRSLDDWAKQMGAE